MVQINNGLFLPFTFFFPLMFGFFGFERTQNKHSHNCETSSYCRNKNTPDSDMHLKQKVGGICCLWILKRTVNRGKTELSFCLIMAISATLGDVCTNHFAPWGSLTYFDAIKKNDKIGKKCPVPRTQFEHLCITAPLCAECVALKHKITRINKKPFLSFAFWITLIQI